MRDKWPRKETGFSSIPKEMSEVRIHAHEDLHIIELNAKAASLSYWIHGDIEFKDVFDNIDMDQQYRLAVSLWAKNSKIGIEDFSIIDILN